MNISQKQNTSNAIASILEMDFDNHYLNMLPEGTQIDSVQFGEWGIARFKELLFKAVKQLKNEIENGIGDFLPNAENFHNDFGSINIDGDIQALHGLLQNYSDKDRAADLLRRVIYYEVRQGFWDKSAVKKHDVDEEKIVAFQSQLDISQKNLDRNIESFQKLNEEYRNKLTEFDGQLNTSKEQLASIEQLLNSASASNNTIGDLLASARNKDTEITGLRENIAEKIKTVTDNIASYQSSFETIQTDANNLTKQLQTCLDSATNNLTTSKEWIAFIESKKDEIVRLTGMAADGSLGSRFDKRESELAGGLAFWKWGIPIATSAAVVWVIVVFTCLQVHTTNVWINLLINLLKTSPAFVLMGFVFKQYAKERNLQEEYAFKSAVAMTLTSYSSMLEKSDEETNKSRQQMLLKSIEQVYNQPRIYHEKNDTMFSFKTKDLKEAVTNLTGTVKEVKKTLDEK